jgi:hypothetical protein
LANVYLHKLDKWIVREWEEKKTKRKYTSHNNTIAALRKVNLKPAYLVRYADDWVLITDTKSHAEKWKKRIEKFLDTDLKLKLSPEKTLITDVREKEIHFLGFSYKQVPSENARKGYITRTRPDKERLKSKVNELRKRTRMIRKLNGKQLVNEINNLNSALIGISNYYQVATWVNIELNKFADSLKYTAYKALKVKGGQWTPANKCSNLIQRHENYTTKIPATLCEGRTPAQFPPHNSGENRRNCDRLIRKLAQARKEEKVIQPIFHENQSTNFLLSPMMIPAVEMEIAEDILPSVNDDEPYVNLN